MSFLLSSRFLLGEREVQMFMNTTGRDQMLYYKGLMTILMENRKYWPTNTSEIRCSFTNLEELNY